MTTFSLPAVRADGGLTQYFQDIWKFPILPGDEEQMLAVRWRDHGDVDAAHKLVTSHLRLVAKIAMGYRGYGLPVADLISEGNIGLMKAVKKFEPERGFRLSTYAMWWIRAAITEYILRSWSLVKTGTLSAQKKLFFGLGRIKRQLNILEDGELDPDQARLVAENLDVSEKDVIQMDRRLSSRDLSLNAPRSHADGEGAEFQDSLVDESPSPESLTADREETSYRVGLLQKAMEQLDERERHIISERRLSDDPVTLEELGRIYGISRERIRQLEERAFKKIRVAVQEMTAAAVSAGRA
ncbi:MAG: RNA polymerase sigma factor RpoH [Candidatus Binatia bacterium]